MPADRQLATLGCGVAAIILGATTPRVAALVNGRTLFVSVSPMPWWFSALFAALALAVAVRVTGWVLRIALVANRDHVGEQFAGFENVEHGLSLILRNIDPDLAHRFDGQRVERFRFEPRAVCFKQIDTDLVEKRFRHLAASAVMNTDE